MSVMLGGCIRKVNFPWMTNRICKKKLTKKNNHKNIETDKRKENPTVSKGESEGK